MTTRCRLAATAALLCLAACGSSALVGPSLTVSPASATTVAGSAATTFTAALTNSTATVTWTLAGPGSITPTSGSSTAYTPPATTASSTSATLTASAGALTAHATITINPPPTITVAGTLLDFSGGPIENATVAIGNATATTDTFGHFSFPNVTPPYDLGFLLQDTSPYVQVYQGLTRSDPTIVRLFGGSGPVNTGTITGNLSGGDALPAPDATTAVAFGSPEASGSNEAPTNPYSLELGWNGPSATTGTVHALQWGPLSGLPTTYKGHGQKTNVSVTNGGPTSNVDIVMSAVSTETITGTVSVPTGFTIRGKRLNIDFPDRATFTIGSDTSSDTSFDFSVPGSIGATAAIRVASQGSVGQTITRVAGIQPGSTGTTITVPAPSVPSAPADGETGVTSATEFTWTGLAGGIHIVKFEGPPGKPIYAVASAGTTTRIPDLTALGQPLPGATAYTWAVSGLAPFADMDALAGTSTLTPVVGPYTLTGSEPRSFTTQSPPDPAARSPIETRRAR